MIAKTNPPLFTLRGHNVGVTALAHCKVDDNSYLLSGDEEGSIYIWDVSILRKVISFPSLLGSRTQTLKVITLMVIDRKSEVLLCQSRDGGVQCLDLAHIISGGAEVLPKILATFPTYDSIFSRGDALNIDNDKAILAYPSCIERYLVTVRIVGDDVQTLLSGTAQRNFSEKEKTYTVFDILINQNSDKESYLFVAYEDGYLCMFSFNINVTKTVPLHDSTGLRIDLIKKFNLNVGDFISAFDVINVKDNGILAVCGSPLKILTFIAQSLSSPTNNDPITKNIELRRKGVSAIRIRPDKKLVAIACWDTTVRLYSMESQQVLASLNHHSKQVQSILFIEKLDIYDYATFSGQQDYDRTEKKYLMCCASMEGTISISSIY